MKADYDMTPCRTCGIPAKEHWRGAALKCLGWLPPEKTGWRKTLSTVADALVDVTVRLFYRYPEA